MLVRLIIDNIFSFGRQTEFNTIPSSQRSLPFHAYPQTGGFKTLKLSALYGANAAGKSNMVNALSVLQGMVTGNLSGNYAFSKRFKLDCAKTRNEQTFAVEFVKNSQSYLYAIMIDKGIISVEELYKTSRNDSKLVFERKTDKDGITTIRFSDELEKNPEIELMKAVLTKQFIKPNHLLWKLLAEREIEQLADVSSAYQWFDSDLVVLFPSSKPVALAQRISTEKAFGVFLDKMISSFHAGIDSLVPHKIHIDKFFGEGPKGKETAQVLKDRVALDPKKVIQLTEQGSSRELLLVMEDEDVWVKTLRLNHRTSNASELVPFELPDESEGTVRLLHLLPAFYDILYNKAVYVIDEIERSIHPSLIKELIRKYSQDRKSKGQLIFTTHESVLLDQKMFRQDEIWFAEKDEYGCTDLYSLSDYKEHRTIDIRKGYLEGRYGAIPFLGNLQDLSWLSDVDSV